MLSLNPHFTAACIAGSLGGQRSCLLQEPRANGMSFLFGKHRILFLHRTVLRVQILPCGHRAREDMQTLTLWLPLLRLGPRSPVFSRQPRRCSRLPRSLAVG